MTTTTKPLPVGVLLLGPGEGRHYPCGPMHVDAPTGTFLRTPAGVTHDFENRTASRAGALNVFIPGGFEANMPSIVEWFRTHAATHE